MCCGLRRAGREARPLVAGRHAERPAQRLDLRRRGDRRVIERIAGERQAPALDRVGQDHGRPVALAARPRRRRRGSAPGRDRRRRPPVRPARRRSRRRADGRARRRCRRRRRSPAPCARRRPARAAVAGTRRSTSPPAAPAGAHRPVARSSACSRRPQRSSSTRQPLARNISASWRGPRVGHDAVEALAIDVDDPQHVAEPPHDLLAQRLPDVALVQLGVADHHDEALGRGAAAVIEQIARGQAAERGGDRAQPHRAGRQIDHARVLAPARIGLQTAEGPERLQIVDAETAAQVLDRVERGRGVRLDRDDVGRAQRRRSTARSAGSPTRPRTPDARRPSARRRRRAVLAWWTIHALSHNTRRWMRSRTSRSIAAMAEYTAGFDPRGGGRAGDASVGRSTRLRSRYDRDAWRRRGRGPPRASDPRWPLHRPASRPRPRSPSAVRARSDGARSRP